MAVTVSFRACWDVVTVRIACVQPVLRHTWFSIGKMSPGQIVIVVAVLLAIFLGQAQQLLRQRKKMAKQEAQSGQGVKDVVATSWPHGHKIFEQPEAISILATQPCLNPTSQSLWVLDA